MLARAAFNRVGGWLPAARAAAAVQQLPRRRPAFQRVAQDRNAGRRRFQPFRCVAIRTVLAKNKHR